MSNFQFYERLYQYVHEYQDLVYDKYSQHHIRYLTTYYNLDTTSTIWEDTKIYGGAYEKIGDLSGIQWNKYLLVPVYFVDEISTVFDGQESGYTKMNETHIIIPSSYGITPYPNDIIKLEQEFLRPTNDVYPMFIVSGIEISANADRRYWKLKIETVQSRTTTELEEQVNNTYTYFEYTKKIYTVPQASFLTRMMVKNSAIKDRLDDLYDPNTGFYFTI